MVRCQRTGSHQTTPKENRRKFQVWWKPGFQNTLVQEKHKWHCLFYLIDESGSKSEELSNPSSRSLCILTTSLQQSEYGSDVIGAVTTVAPGLS